MPAYKKKGFLIGLALFFLMMLFPPPAELSSAGWTHQDYGRRFYLDVKVKF